MTARPTTAWIDGVPDAAVSALDRGLHYGDGLFETITCLDGAPRFAAHHLARLERGCRRLGLPALPPGLTQDELARAASGQARAILKLMVTRGEAQARGYACTGSERATRILLRYPWPAEPGDREHAGVRVRIGALRYGENPQLAGIKHLNRLEQVLARQEWSDSAVFESLHMDRSGWLVSGTMSNLFLVRAGALFTPSLERSGVAGVMRSVVIEAARAAGIAALEDRLGIDTLSTAEEIFLTNVRIGVVPVTALEGRALGVGPVTRRLQELTARAR